MECTQLHVTYCFVQITIVHQHTQSKERDDTPTIATYTEGTILACFLPEYADEEPQLGRVTKEHDANDDDIEIEWMVGTYTEPWQLWKQRSGRNYCTWKETISSSAVLFPVKLSNGGRLNNNMIGNLKTIYEERRNNLQ